MAKQKWKQLLRHPYLPFALLWVFLLVCHLTFVMEAGDEVYYGAVLQNSNLWDFSVYHYFNWSSRTFIEIVLSVMSYLPKLVWRLVDPFMVVIVTVRLAYICGLHKSQKGNWIICGFVLLYRWELMRTAGWIATTLVYLWPAAFALLALVPVAQFIKGKKPRGIWCAASLLALLYATNMEQVAVIALLLLAGLCVYLVATRQKPHWVIPAQMAVCTANIIYALLSPGSAVRFAVEQTQWFPNFGMRSLFQKAELGLATALNPLFYARDYVFAFFLVLLAFAVWQRHKNWLYRLIGLAPLLVCLPLGFYGRYVQRVLPGISFFTAALTGEGIITLANGNILLAYLPLLLLLGAFVACLAALYLALGHTPAAFAGIWALCSGLASRAMMGFSPSVWTSGDRTGFFFSLACIGVAGLLVKKMQPARRWQKIAFYVVFAAYVALQMYSMAEM